MCFNLVNLGAQINPYAVPTFCNPQCMPVKSCLVVPLLCDVCHSGSTGSPPDDDDFPMLMAPECCAAWQPEHVAPRMLNRMFKDGREKAEKFLCVSERAVMLCC